MGSYLSMPLATRPVRWIALFTALSWLGEYVHNRVDLPELTLLSPENSLPALLSIVLFLICWRFLKRYPFQLSALLSAANCAALHHAHHLCSSSTTAHVCAYSATDGIRS